MRSESNPRSVRAILAEAIGPGRATHDNRRGFRASFCVRGTDPETHGVDERNQVVVMFIRTLAILLLLANLGFGAWIARAALAPRPVLAATDPGVPELKLVHANAATAKANAPVAVPGTCVALGPFATPNDARTAAGALAAVDQPADVRAVAGTEPRGYWVYMAGGSSREAALATARELAAKGVTDYYVVGDADGRNVISLGVFHERANAERRQADLESMGYDAILAPRDAGAPEYWIDLESPGAVAFDWRRVLGESAGIGEKPIACRRRGD